MEDERRAGAAVVLVSLGGAVEERRREGHEGEDPLEGDYLVGRIGWERWLLWVFFYCNEEWRFDLLLLCLEREEDCRLALVQYRA